MIERLVIHRFRGIRQGELGDLGQVNLLIGPNNSGKSAILEMLYLGGTSGRPVQFIRADLSPEEGIHAATTSVPTDFLGHSPLPRLRLRHGKGALWPENPTVLTREGGLQVNLRSLDNANGYSPWEDFRLGAPLEEWGVKQSRQFTQDDIEQVALFTLAHPNNIHTSMIPPYFEEVKLRAEETRWHYLWQPGWAYQGEPKAPIDQLAVWADAGRPPQANRVLFCDFHTAAQHFTRPFAQWAKDQTWDWTKLVGDRLARIFPDLAGARVDVDDAPDGQQGESGYIRTGQGRLPIDQYGDGARHAFKVLAALVALAESVDEEHPGLFLWEDPELFMHPGALYLLLNEVMQLIHDRPIQLFLSCHSLELVGLLTDYFKTNHLMRQELLRAFRLKLEGGQLYAAKFRFENLYAWLEQGMDPRFWDAAALPISYCYHKTESTFTEEEI